MGQEIIMISSIDKAKEELIDDFRTIRFKGEKIGPPKVRQGRKYRECLICGAPLNKGRKYIYIPYWVKGSFARIQTEKGEEVLFRPYTISICRAECLNEFYDEPEKYISKLRETEHFQEYYAVNAL